MSTSSYSSGLLAAVTFGYFAAALFYLLLLVFKKSALGRIGTGLTILTASFHTIGIAWRWIESYQIGYGHAPFSNLYESLIFFGWTIAVVYLIIEYVYKNKAIGVFVMPLAFLSMAYAGLQPSEIQPLVPALKSNWLIAHVIACFLGYSGFALAAGLAVIFLIQKQPGAGKLGGVLDLFPPKAVLDALIYQNIVVGFLLLTAGIITGSVWAHSAWGSYWSWDPKETWSLITWLMYAAVLHARMVRGWSGKRIAILAIIGFGCVLFTYFGVNLLLTGLHSYAG